MSTENAYNSFTYNCQNLKGIICFSIDELINMDCAMRFYSEKNITNNKATKDIGGI